MKYALSLVVLTKRIGTIVKLREIFYSKLVPELVELRLGYRNIHKRLQMGQNFSRPKLNILARPRAETSVGELDYIEVFNLLLHKIS